MSDEAPKAEIIDLKAALDKTFHDSFRRDQPQSISDEERERIHGEFGSEGTGLPKFNPMPTAELEANPRREAYAECIPVLERLISWSGLLPCHPKHRVWEELRAAEALLDKMRKAAE